MREKEVQAKQPLVQSAPVASATSAAAAPMSTRAPLANATAQDQANDSDSGGNQGTPVGQQPSYEIHDGHRDAGIL